MESSKMTAVGDKHWACPHPEAYGANLSYQSGSWSLNVWHPEQEPWDRESSEAGIREIGILPYSALQLPVCYYIVQFKALSIEGSFSADLGKVTAEDVAAMQGTLEEARNQDKVPSVSYRIMNPVGIIRRQGFVSFSAGWWNEFLSQLGMQVESSMSGKAHKLSMASIEAKYSPDQVWGRCRTERLRKVDIISG